MKEQLLVDQLASAVIRDVQFWVAAVGFVGVVVGAVVTAAGNVFLHWYQHRQGSRLDNARKKLLRQMLDSPKFKEGRSLEQLSKVTGSTNDECRRLLVEIEGRGLTLKDGREGWTYIRNLPLDEQ